MRLRLGLRNLRQLLTGAYVPSLSTLAISQNVFASGTAADFNILGANGGSTIAISGNPASITINSLARTGHYDGTGSPATSTFTLTETLAGATGSPNPSTISYSITGAGGGVTALTAPTISGDAVVGQTLHVMAGTYSPAADSVSEQWNLGGVALGGETTDTLLILDSYVGSAITVSEIGHKASFADSAANVSSATATVAAIDLTNAITSITRTSASGVTPMTVDIAFGSNVYAGYILDRIVYTDSALTTYKNGAEYNSIASHVLTDGDLQAGATIDWSADGGPTIAATDWAVYRVRTTSPNSVGYMFTYGTAISPTDAAVALTWSATDKAAGVVLSAGGLDAAANTGSYQGVRATSSKTSGKWYYEAKIVGGFNNPEIGWANSSWSLSDQLGWTNTNSVAFAPSTSILYNGNAGSGPTGTWSAGDIIQCCIDIGTDTVWFGRNNTFAGSPSAGTGGVSVPGVGSTVFPAFTANAGEILAAFKASDQTYSPPSGFTAIG